MTVCARRPAARRSLLVGVVMAWLCGVSPAAQEAAPAAPQEPTPPTQAPPPAPAPAPGQPAPGQPAGATPAPAAGLVFTSDAGFVIFTVKTEGAADFEAFFQKLKQALHQRVQPEYVQMAEGWKLFRVADLAQAGQVLYASLMEPAVAAADYDPLRIVTEVFPAEAPDLIAKLKEAVLSVNRMSLDQVMEMAR